MEILPLPVKGYKFWLILETQNRWALIDLLRAHQNNQKDINSRRPEKAGDTVFTIGARSKSKELETIDKTWAGNNAKRTA